MSPNSTGRVPLYLGGLTGTNDVFRLSGGVERDSAVEAWFADTTGGLRALAQQWFARIRASGEDVLELIHDGCPVACVEDVPFAYVNSFKGHVNVGFYRGAFLADPHGILEGSGKRMRHVKLIPGREVDASALRELIGTAYLDVRARLASER